ncbi:MAG: DNA repair protein RecN [Clostridia bacterium]|nr:DNA repair protein RecN [Clostridia bacterium]
MLRRLYIENVALIRKLEIEFSEGFNVLTGETGAGKSIIIDAVNLVLGERATKELIKHGADKAKVVAVFDVSQNKTADAMLLEVGIEKCDELILSRELSMQGKNMCRINSVPVTLATLKKVSDTLVDVHGQHEHQKLMDTASHIEFLDLFKGEDIAHAKEAVSALFEHYSTIKKKMLSGFMSEAEREREMDMLSFQINEIESAKITVGETEELKAERNMLRNAEKIMGAMENAYASLSGEYDAVSALKASAQELLSISQYSDDYNALFEKLNDIYYAAEDAAIELRELKLNFEFEPSRIDIVEERIDTLASLKRKYGNSEEDILSYLEQSRARLEQLRNSAEENEKYRSQLENIKTDYLCECEKLTLLRKEAAKVLEKSLLDELAQLGMEKARFEAAFELSDEETLLPDGRDKVEFMLSANSGEALKPLALVASGGEMSRIMLAFKAVFADNDDMDTLIFDEIDTGISGKVAGIVGDKMKKISQNHQVICVTHLPQIAALSSNHHEVQKTDNGVETVVEVRCLDDVEREKAIARMLGGNEFEETALQHARQLISKK